MKEKLANAIEDFVTQRMDDIGTDAPEAVEQAIAQVGLCGDNLSSTLTEAQMHLWHALEDAQCHQTGEETRYYYRSGFRDAVQFLQWWGNVG